MCVKFVNFLKSRLIFNVFYCLGMFVNKLFTYLKCAYLKKQKVFKCEIFNIFFSDEDGYVGSFPNLHWCTLNSQFISKKGQLRLCLKEINWYCQQTWLDLVFLSIYKDHLRKLRRVMGPGWILGRHHIGYLSRQIFWCYHYVLDNTLILVWKITFEPF